MGNTMIYTSMPFVSKILKMRRFLLWKQLMRTSAHNNKPFTFVYFKNITFNQHNTPYLLFFKVPQTSLFWTKNTDWDFHIQPLWKFNAEYLNYQFFRDVLELRAKNLEIIENMKLSPAIALKYRRCSQIKYKLFAAFIQTYNTILSKIFFERHFWFKNYVDDNVLEVILNLTLSFRKNQLFLHLQDLKKRDYCFASLGFFIKFFAKKKSLKKNKIMKFLLAKFIRKLFIISNILVTNLIVRGLPTNLSEMLVFINQPLRHKFIDPEDGSIIDESKIKVGGYRIKFNYIIFIKNKAFGFVRLRQKGRIKRKLVRKLTKRGKITD